MPPIAPLLDRLTKIFDQWYDLVETLTEEELSLHLGTLRSNSIGEQLWCLGGCRESTLASLAEDTSFSWRCSFQGSTRDPAALSGYLRKQGEAVLALLRSDLAWTENQHGLVLDLLAHEFQHQGQMIRYLYGNDLSIPPSWQDFWHLTP